MKSQFYLFSWTSFTHLLQEALKSVKHETPSILTPSIWRRKNSLMGIKGQKPQEEQRRDPSSRMDRQIIFYIHRHYNVETTVTILGKWNLYEECASETTSSNFQVSPFLAGRGPQKLCATNTWKENRRHVDTGVMRRFRDIWTKHQQELADTESWVKKGESGVKKRGVKATLCKGQATNVSELPFNLTVTEYLKDFRCSIPFKKTNPETCSNYSSLGFQHVF